MSVLFLCETDAHSINVWRWRWQRLW